MSRGWMGHPPYDPGSGSGAQVLVSLDFHETTRDIAALALELKPEFSAGQPGTWMTRWASRQVKQHGGVASRAETDGKAPFTEDQLARGVDEAAVEGPGLALLVPPQLLGEQRIEGVGDQGQGDIEIYIHRDSRAQGV